MIFKLMCSDISFFQGVEIVFCELHPLKVFFIKNLKNLYFLFPPPWLPFGAKYTMQILPLPHFICLPPNHSQISYCPTYSITHVYVNWPYVDSRSQNKHIMAD